MSGSAATQLAQRVIDLDPESAAAYRLRGDVFQRQRRWREGLAAYHRELSIQPNNAEVQMSAAQVYQRDGRSQRALSTLQSLAATYPPGEQPADLLYWQGIAFSGLGRHRQAIRYFAQAESRGMHTADLQFRLAESNHLSGEPTAARSALERAVELDPHHPQAARLCELIQGPLHVARVRD